MKAQVLKLSVEFPPDMRRALLVVEIPRAALEGFQVDPKKPLTVEIKRKVKRRSLSANAYCWVLCQEIARRVRFIGADDVYRKAIQAVGQFVLVHVPKEQARDLEASWRRNGAGWVPVRIDGGYGPIAEYKCYKGSSVYTTEEMARLIDWLVDEAKNLGIDTTTPEERARLLSAWEPGK